MPSFISRAPAGVDAERLTGGSRPAASTLQPTSGADVRPPPLAAAGRLTGARLRKLVSYYRPHVGLLLADLACAILVSATTLALPICANFVIRRLSAPHAGAALVGQIELMG